MYATTAEQELLASGHVPRNRQQLIDALRTLTYRVIHLHGDDDPASFLAYAPGTNPAEHSVAVTYRRGRFHRAEVLFPMDVQRCTTIKATWREIVG